MYVVCIAGCNNWVLNVTMCMYVVCIAGCNNWVLNVTICTKSSWVLSTMISEGAN